MAQFKAPFAADDVVFWHHPDVADNQWVRGKVCSVDLHPADGKFVARIAYRGMVVKHPIPMDDIVSAQGGASTWAAQLAELNSGGAAADPPAEEEQEEEEEQPDEPLVTMVHTLQGQVNTIFAQLNDVTKLVKGVATTQARLLRGQSSAKHCLNQLRYCADPDQIHEFDTLWPYKSPRSTGGGASGLQSPKPSSNSDQPPASATSEKSHTSTDSFGSLAASLPELTNLVDVGSPTLGTQFIMQLEPNSMVTAVDGSNGEAAQDHLVVFAMPIQQIQADDSDGTWTVRYHSQQEMEQLLFARLYPNHDEMVDISFGTFQETIGDWTTQRYGHTTNSCHFSYETQYFPLPPAILPPTFSVDSDSDLSEWRVEVVGPGGDLWPVHDKNTLSALMRVIAAPVQTAINVGDQCLAFNRMLKLQQYDRQARGRYEMAYGNITYEQEDEPSFLGPDDDDYDSDSADTIRSITSTASADVRRAAGYSALGLPLHKVSALIDWTKMEGVELIRLDPRVGKDGSRGAGGACSGKYAEKGWKCVGLKRAFIAEMIKRKGGDYPTVESCAHLNPFTIRDHELRSDRQSSSKLKVRFEELYFPVDMDGNQHTIPWLKWFAWDPMARLRAPSVSATHDELFLQGLGLVQGDTYRFCAQQGLLYSENSQRAFAKMAFASARDAATNSIKVITYYRFLTDAWESPNPDAELEQRRVKVLDAIKGTVFATIGDGPALKKRKRKLDGELGDADSDAGTDSSGGSSAGNTKKKGKKGKKKDKGKKPAKN